MKSARLRLFCGFLLGLFLIFSGYAKPDVTILQKDGSLIPSKGESGQVEAVKPYGFHCSDEQFTQVTDSFGNEVAAWIAGGVVYASEKSCGADWQPWPDSLSTRQQHVSDLHLAVDSIGNVFAVWQALPSKAIQSAFKNPAGKWEINTLTDADESGCDPQIAQGLEGYATVSWKSEDSVIKLAEIALHTDSVPAFDHDDDDIAHLEFEDDILPALSEEISSIPSDQEMFTEQELSTFVVELEAASRELSKSSTPLTLSRNQIAQLPSSRPFPPVHLKGHQKLNRFATQEDLVNEMSWKASKKGPTAIAYKIYRNAHLTDLAAIIPAHGKLKFKDHNRKKNRVYTYFIVAVDANGIQSPPAIIIFSGHKTHAVNVIAAVSISIVPVNPTISIGATQQFFVVVTFSDGSVKQLTDGTQVPVFESSGSSGRYRPSTNYYSRAFVNPFHEDYALQVQSGNQDPLFIPVIWSSSNPNVASINAQGLATGLSPGTTTITGTFDNLSASTTLTVTSTCPAPTITTSSLPNGTVGVPYSQTIQTTGGVSPMAFSIASGALPPGLTLNGSTGTISGTPSSSGTFNFTLQAQSSCGALATQPLSITISSTCVAPIITTTSLPGGITGVSYSQSIAATGTAPITFSVVSGALPSGLTLSSTGVISGTPIATGTFSFTVKATNACGSFTQPLSIAITAACVSPVITTSTLPGGVVGTSYAQQINATGSAPLSFSIVSGALPGGLILNPSNGVIAGTPTVTGPFSFTVQASNACGTFNQALSIDIAAACVNPTITTTSLPNGGLSIPYSQTINVTGSAPFTFSVGSGALPGGLSLNPSTGLISGTPTVTGIFSFTVHVSNACGSSDEPLSITIPCASLSITTTSLPGGTVGTSYAATVATSGGVAPLTFTVSSGVLPAGLALDSTNGAISGAPAFQGVSNFTITVTDSCSSGAQTVSQPLSITVNGPCSPLLSITTTSLPDATVGTFYVAPLSSSGGIPLVFFSIPSGSLPAGLSLVSLPGLILGTPTGPAGTSNFILAATDSCPFGQQIATQPLSITVTGTCPTLSITTTSLPDGPVGTFYDQTIATSGGVVPLTFSISAGALPNGLSINGSTGEITGTPTGPAALATFTVQVKDSCGTKFQTATQHLTINITGTCPTLSITTTSLPDGTLAIPYSQTIATSGGVVPLTFSISTGALPTGLSIGPSTGIISGTPTVPGTFNFTVQVQDSCSPVAKTATKALSITIGGSCPLLSITTMSLSGGTVGVPYSQTVATSGGVPPLTFSISSPSLPPGLSIDSSTGVISGTPTNPAGTANFTVQVQDSCTLGIQTASKPLSITIGPCAAPTITTTSLGSGVVGDPYSHTVHATGAGLSFSAAALPPGLSIDPASGIISGTPTTAAIFHPTVTVTNVCGSDTHDYNLRIFP